MNKVIIGFREGKQIMFDEVTLRQVMPDGSLGQNLINGNIETGWTKKNNNPLNANRTKPDRMREARCNSNNERR